MKKYLFFIVEGKNDKIEIQAMLRATLGSEFLNNYVDAYHIHKGDITADNDSSEKTIIKKLEKIVVSWRNGKEEPFQKIHTSDVDRIIHIIDTDGVFIPESGIIQTEDAKANYQDRVIQYFDRERMVGRNRKKAKIIRKLLDVKHIDNIPYMIFFVSCNMDHVLFDDRNSIEKGRNARWFASQCKNRQFLNDSVFADGICSNESFFESWNMIQKDFNSLHRHTNINIMLDDIIKPQT